MKSKKRMNILFMLSDDHAVQAISACGSKVNKTPNIDRIAAEGAVFRESFCCNSICTPSRAAILTGKHSFQNGVLTLQDHFDGSQVTVQKLLQESGYQTAIVGKWHLHTEPTGFDYWKILPGQGNYYNPDFITPEGTVRESGYSADIIADEIIKWLDSGLDSEKPFLAMCHFKAPHRPWCPHPRYFDLYEDDNLPAPENLRDDYSGRCSILKNNEMEIGRHLQWDYDLKVTDPGPNRSRLHINAPEGEEGRLFELNRMDEKQREAYLSWNRERNRKSGISDRKFNDDEFIDFVYQRYLKDYLRCIAAIDDNVGRILDYLDESGLADETIVVYCSDQGFYLGEHGWFDKRWMFEESFRMPLLMKWPGKIAPGTDFNQLVQNIDYAPTFLDIAGVDIPEEMHGESLLKVIDDGDTIHDDLYYHYYVNGGEHNVPRHDGIRTKRFKLIHFYTEKEFNLFDLESDPSEMKSLHNDPDYAGTLEEMKTAYYAARERYDIPEMYGPESE